jgi:3-phenylpropionate/cinnamic acid dioxygenase small subunit
MTDTATNGTALGSSAPVARRSPIRSTDERYADALEFLFAEAELLDTGQIDAWLQVLTDDIVYHMPARLSTRRRDDPGFSSQTDIFADNKASLTVRANRLHTSFAWAEDPPSRTRHFVSNVRVYETAGPDEIEVRSSLLLYRTRSDQAQPDLFSGERRDLLRRVAGAWRLARRTILLDQTVVNARHLSVLF